MNALNMAFGLIGGLGLFLYGMRTMGDGLQKAAGDGLRRLIGSLTSNVFLGVLVGAVVTAIIQSSSATTVMTVGFVNAGLMTLRQSVGVIMGANIGTTMTAQLIAFKLEAYALPAIGIGVALILFARTKRIKYVGQIFAGFGMLFLGMDIMKDAMKPLGEVQVFKDAMISLGENRFYGVLVGLGMTATIQSSSATIGILQGLATEGLISLEAALPILFGDNIGTTVTAMLSSIGTSLAARRAAFTHLLFNLTGTIIFVLLMPLIIPLVQWTSSDPAREIANAHTIFNVTNTLIQLPFVGFLVWLVRKIVPGEERVVERGTKYLDRRLLDTPSVAQEQAVKELVRMGEIAKSTIDDSVEGLINCNSALIESAYKHEKILNELEREITHYLVEISKRSLTDEQAEFNNLLLSIVNDIERVGDHADNIAELGEYRIDHQLPFSEMAVDDLRKMHGQVVQSFDKAMCALKTGDTELARDIFKAELNVDQLEAQFRASHIERLNQGKCNPSSGVLFLDTISNLERIGDHSANIANGLIDGSRHEGPRVTAVGS